MATNSWKQFMETSTIHGLGEIVRSKGTPEKVFFILSLFVCNFFSFYGTYQIIMQYVKQPVATSFFVNEADVLQLPDVTICPFNRLNTEFLAKHQVSQGLAKYIEWAFFPVNPKYDFIDLATYIDARTGDTSGYAKQLNDVLRRGNMTFEEFMERSTMTCESLIQSCEQQYMKFNCCNDSRSVITGMGRCFRISGRNQISPGFGTGTTIILKLPLDSYSPAENMLMNDGIMIKLTEPNKGYEFDAIFVPTGVHALLQLRATLLDFMDDPPRFSCRHESPNETYAPLVCYQKCLLREAHANCSCRYIGLPLEKNDSYYAALRPCLPSELLTCLYPSLGRRAEEDPSFQKRCKEGCESRCHYWQYKATVSYARYPSYTLTNSYFAGDENQKRNTVNDRLSREIILELFYDKLEYTLIKHFPSMSVDQFIANIGGQMGLWMGGSILSIIHLLVFLILWSREKGRQGTRLVKQKQMRVTWASPEDCSPTQCGVDNVNIIPAYDVRRSSHVINPTVSDDLARRKSSLVSGQNCLTRRSFNGDLKGGGMVLYPDGGGRKISDAGTHNALLNTCRLDHTGLISHTDLI